MPASPETNRYLGKFGRIVKPVAFDPVQFLLWERDRIYTLEIEVYINGAVGAHAELSPELCGEMAADLRRIRDGGMKGEWRLGAWARGMRFRFYGLNDAGEIRARFSFSGLVWFMSTACRVRQGSFNSLLQELEVLSSNKAMERTVNDKVPRFARAFGALNGIWRRWAAAHRHR